MGIGFAGSGGMALRRLGVVAFMAVLSALGFSGNEVTTWNQTALTTIQQKSVAPPVVTRALAMLSTAQYDALNSIQGGYKGFASFDQADAGASMEAATAQSSYRILSTLFPDQEAVYRAQLNDTLGRVPDSASRDAGIAAGNKAANAVIQLRANDGMNTGGIYTGGNLDGQWRPTPDGYKPGALPNWGNQTMWVASSGLNTAPGAPQLGSAEYAHAFNEVKAFGSVNSVMRTQDQTDMAYFWAAGSGTVTPPGMWNLIGGQIASDRNMGLMETARMFGAMNVAMADAGIAAWDVKYTDSFWRPMTAIHNAGTDGNILTTEDDSWVPLLATPNHPSYVSGHSTFSSAGAAALRGILGSDQVSVTLTSDGITRSFTSLSDMAMEAGMSRIYGGIHFNFDNTDGLALGTAIGDGVLASNFEAVPEPATMVLLGLGALALKRKKK